MKSKNFKKVTLTVLFVLVAFVTVALAGPIWDNSDRRWGGISYFDGGTPQIFQGATQDAFTTTFAITDPTADRTITFPDGDITIGTASNHTSLTTITVTDATTNVVADLLTTSHTGGAVAAGFGTGFSFDMEDAGGVEEQGSTDMVFTTVTDGAEDVDYVITQNDNGALSETLRIVADADGTTEGTRMQLTSASAETNGVNDLLVLKASGGTTTAGFGVGIDMQAEFADGVETATKIEGVWTDVSTGSEDADFVISAKDAGALAELARFDSDGNFILEGATSDGNVLTITPTDPAADKTLTLPTTTNAAAMITSLTTNDVDVANSIWGVSNGLAMGGATGANTFEVTLSPQTDPAASIAVGLPSLTNGAVMISSLTTNDVNVANSIWAVSNGLAFGGATGANGFEVTVSPGADPGADVALTLPTASGAISTAIGAGSLKTVESLTATDVQTVADCGKTLLMTHATVAIVVTLPAPAGISGCEFTVKMDLATNQGHTIVTNASANLIRGSIQENQGGAGSYQAAGDLITFAAGFESIGDTVHLITDGTSWFVDGMFELAGGITQGST